MSHSFNEWFSVYKKRRISSEIRRFCWKRTAPRYRDIESRAARAQGVAPRPLSGSKLDPGAFEQLAAADKQLVGVGNAAAGLQNGGHDLAPEAGVGDDAEGEAVAHPLRQRLQIRHGRDGVVHHAGVDFGGIKEDLRLLRPEVPIEAHGRADALIHDFADRFRPAPILKAELMERNVHSVEPHVPIPEGHPQGVALPLLEDLGQGGVLLEDLIPILIPEEPIYRGVQGLQLVPVGQLPTGRCFPVGLYDLTTFDVPEPGVNQGLAHLDFHSWTTSP